MLLKAQVIKWEESRPLIWSDFQAPRGTGWSASVHTETNYTYKVLNVDCDYVIVFDIQNNFDPQRSMTWSVNGFDEYLLTHEQLHFDINELFTRRLAAAFYSAKYTDNFKTEIEEIYNKNRAELDAMEAKYDGESQHSQNGKMQLQWNLFIYWQLKKLPRNY